MHDFSDHDNRLALKSVDIIRGVYCIIITLHERRLYYDEAASSEHRAVFKSRGGAFEYPRCQKHLRLRLETFDCLLDEVFDSYANVRLDPPELLHSESFVDGFGFKLGLDMNLVCFSRPVAVLTEVVSASKWDESKRRSTFVTEDPEIKGEIRDLLPDAEYNVVVRQRVEDAVDKVQWSKNLSFRIKTLMKRTIYSRHRLISHFSSYSGHRLIYTR